MRGGEEGVGWAEVRREVTGGVVVYICTYFTGPAVGAAVIALW